MKKIILSLLISVMLVMGVSPALATDYWDITGDWVLEFDYLSTLYIHDMTIVDNTFTGTGGYPSGGSPYSITWTVTGTIDGNNIEMRIDYDSSSYYVDVIGTIAQDGTMSGTWSNPSQSGIWESTMGTAMFVDITPPEITFVEPTDGSIQHGLMHLKATCNEECDYVNFWWRAESEPFAWYRYHYVHDDGTVFEWDLNTLNAKLAQNQGSYIMEDGVYYLYAAGKDLAGNWARTPEIMVYVINNKLVHGGGHILEVVEEGDKRKNWLDISFGGMLGEAGAAGLVGEWQVNLHNVNKDSLNKGKFHTTEFTALNFYDGNGTTCNDAMNFTAFGTWNGEAGYKMIFRAGDNGSPNNVDTVRVTLYNPDTTVLYDTHWGGEFTDESTCVGTARTSLDTGNIIIQR